VQFDLCVKTLDVGCGDRPTGDVNLDLFYYGRGKNYVIGEAHHLPFGNRVFEKVYCSNALEHFANPLAFFKEARRVSNGWLQCIYPTDSMIKKKTVHNLLNLRWSAAFHWKAKVTGQRKINYGGHKWQLNDNEVRALLKRAGFNQIVFRRRSFPGIRTDRDSKKWGWKAILNRYLPRWQLETEFIAS